MLLPMDMQGLCSLGNLPKMDLKTPSIWALTGPFQQHISATVGWAFWQYYWVTPRPDWLATRGYPVLEAVAEFWSSLPNATVPNNTISKM